jgi:hypothetical protein
MKRQIIFLITVVFTLNVNAQNIEGSKQYFQQAKAQLENMLSDKEKPNYEKTIFTIENAWYDNQIEKANFDNAMNKHIEAIQELIKNNYDEKAIKQKPSLLITQHEIKDQYMQALTNWAIYTYITSPMLLVDGKDTNTISLHRPYKYSTTDPMATINWQNSQVINLNNTHLGNCFALASFFKILADRLNSNATLCTAPSHIYISHKDDKGTDYNIELGSKYFPGTGMISALTYTTDQAIKSGISQRKLNTKQSIALCLVYLAKGYQHKFSNTSDEFILQCANTAIQYDPKNLNALLLKSEYLANKLTAQNKSITQLQTQSDFIEYQNLIANLYNIGYREMPLEMKNTLIKTYKHEPINKELPKFQTAKGKFATLSWGIFDERHINKPTERIGNTMFNTKTKIITSFTKDQILYNNYDFDPVVFAWNIDPMYAKHPGMSPYHFAVNNPIAFNDPDGNTEYYFNGKWAGSDNNKNNNLIGIVKSKEVYNTIKNAMKENGIYNVSNEMLKNGASDKSMVMIDANVLAKSAEILKIAQVKGADREFGASMNKGENGFSKDAPIVEGPPSEVATGNFAQISLTLADVIIHSHATGTASEGNYTSSMASDEPTDADKKTMANPRVEMFITVGMEGLAEKGKDIYGNYGILKRTAVINIMDKKTYKVDKAITEQQADNILTDHAQKVNTKK